MHTLKDFHAKTDRTKHQGSCVAKKAQAQSERKQRFLSVQRIRSTTTHHVKDCGVLDQRTKGSDVWTAKAMNSS